MDNIIHKVLTLLMLIGGTFLFVQSLRILLDYSGAVYILTFAISIIMLSTGIRAIAKGKISC